MKPSSITCLVQALLVLVHAVFGVSDRDQDAVPSDHHHRFLDIVDRCVLSNDRDEAQRLLNLAMTNPVTHFDDYLDYAIRTAIEYGHREMVELLIEYLPEPLDFKQYSQHVKKSLDQQVMAMFLESGQGLDLDALVFDNALDHLLNLFKAVQEGLSEDPIPTIEQIRSDCGRFRRLRHALTDPLVNYVLVMIEGVLLQNPWDAGLELQYLFHQVVAEFGDRTVMDSILSDSNPEPTSSPPWSQLVRRFRSSLEENPGQRQLTMRFDDQDNELFHQYIRERYLYLTVLGYCMNQPDQADADLEMTLGSETDDVVVEADADSAVQAQSPTQSSGVTPSHSDEATLTSAADEQHTDDAEKKEQTEVDAADNQHTDDAGKNVQAEVDAADNQHTDDAGKNVQAEVDATLHETFPYESVADSVSDSGANPVLSKDELSQGSTETDDRNMPQDSTKNPLLIESGLSESDVVQPETSNATNGVRIPAGSFLSGQPGPVSGHLNHLLRMYHALGMNSSSSSLPSRAPTPADIRNALYTLSNRLQRRARGEHDDFDLLYEETVFDCTLQHVHGMSCYKKKSSSGRKTCTKDHVHGLSCFK